ncbi:MULTISPECIES: UDP-N-acetylglucosamine 2-epimerase (non-hydrolyzing) [unclassified Flavobacterium]|uniref:non-hydrolyzing UDP-N-acetylglucosamine 2-epimerase n=1 Tax=unclassified Flavobacterium TaxID=196869 RepID=UPI00261B9D55|nr:UDP-N-acetylglucosamine 2-epimerase (non-hydrolyzing) [Flavobacterium sp.]
MKITLIAGARPNFMKIAPIIHAIQNAQKKGKDISFRLVHTGQHFDEKMSATFFRELNIPQPDVNLECGGGSQAEQTAAIMIAFEKELLMNPVDLVLVVGDVTSTMACSIVAKKVNIKVAHVEAGIRSFDLTMPEEINRMVTDSITDYFFTTSEIANANLRKSGVSEEAIFFVGNVMIDTLLENIPRFLAPSVFSTLGLQKDNYLVMTLHRPANVDQGEKLKELILTIVNNVDGLPVLFPIHPRTAKIFSDLGIQAENLFIIDPLGYLEFNYLVANAKAVITDSGGITEETTVMGIPCITLRDNTERPETITIGTNELVGTNPSALLPVLSQLLNGKWKKGGIPEKWDGMAAERIVECLLNLQ